MAPSGLRRPNDPPLLILVSLADGPKHGHALAKDIEDFAGVKLGPGALYGAITRLVERGLIEPLGGDDRRRPYRITPPGSAALAEALADMRRVTQRGPGPARAGPGMKPARLLRWYPRAWRERYGEELLALIQDTLDEGRPTWRLRLSVAWGGLRERGHQARNPSKARQTPGQQVAEHLPGRVDRRPPPASVRDVAAAGASRAGDRGSGCAGRGRRVHRRGGSGGWPGCPAGAGQVPAGGRLAQDPAPGRVGGGSDSASGRGRLAYPGRR